MRLVHRDPAGRDDPPAVVVDPARRLSDSALWPMQRRFFAHQGIDAWRAAAVPHAVTNNAALARAYAQLICGFLRDMAGAGRLEPAQPLSLIELGAGTGRFAFLILRALRDLLAVSGLPPLQLRYVMTDVSDHNIAFWRAHPALQPWLADGSLDFARFDAETDDRLRLDRAGALLQAGGQSNPLVAIANYVFDGIAQDAFALREGRIHDCLLSLHANAAEADLDDPSLLQRLTCAYHDGPERPAPYAEAAFNAVLAGYAERLAGSTVLFPVAGLRCLERLAALTTGPALAIVGDRGDLDESSLARRSPALHVHGSVSLPVNFHALGAVVTSRGGTALHPSHGPISLAVAAYIARLPAAKLPATALAYRTAIDQAGPDDLFALRRAVVRQADALDADQLLALIRLSGWDPRVLRDCLPALTRAVPTLSPRQRTDMARTVERAWANHFDLGEAADPAGDVADLLATLAGGPTGPG